MLFDDDFLAVQDVESLGGGHAGQSASVGSVDAVGCSGGTVGADVGALHLAIEVEYEGADGSAAAGKLI